MFLPCLGKCAEFECFMKERMSARKRVYSLCGCEMQLKGRNRQMDGFECTCEKQGKVNEHEVFRRIRSGSQHKLMLWSHMSLCDIMKLRSISFGKFKHTYRSTDYNMLKETSSDSYSFNRELYIVQLLRDEKLGGCEN